MAYQNSLVRQQQTAGTSSCAPLSAGPQRGLAVEGLLRDIALALRATRAIRQAMETGRVPRLADC